MAWEKASTSALEAVSMEAIAVKSVGSIVGSDVCIERGVLCVPPCLIYADTLISVKPASAG